MATSMELHKSINDQLLGDTKSPLLSSKIEFKLTENEGNFEENRRLKSIYKFMAPDPNSGDCLSNKNGRQSPFSIKDDKRFNSIHKPTNGNVNTAVGNGMSKNDGIPAAKHIICSPDRIQLEWKQSTKIGAGYFNLGNTCFMNSVLQCLTHCPPLVNYLLYSKEDHIKNCKVLSFCMTCELVKHMRRSIENSGDVIRPQNIFQRLKQIAKHFQHGRQEDSHEFLRYVIDNIWKSCVMNWESNNSGIKLDNQSKETTFINQIFGGYHRSQITCLCCKFKSNTFDYFMDFILDIKTSTNLQQALEKFIKPEVLQNDNAYKCTNCNKKVPAEKRFTVHRAPNVATFQLKRFDYNRIFGGKITKYITYPETFNLRPYMSEPKGSPIIYRLNAVLVHLGSTSNSGHYFCYVRGCNNNWYLMDDSRVRQVPLEHVLRQEAYILFYVRVPTDVVIKSSAQATITKANQQTSPTANCKDSSLQPSNGINPKITISISGLTSKLVNGPDLSEPVRRLNNPPYVNSNTPMIGPINQPKLIVDSPIQPKSKQLPTSSSLSSSSSSSSSSNEQGTQKIIANGSTKLENGGNVKLNGSIKSDVENKSTSTEMKIALEKTNGNKSIASASTNNSSNNSDSSSNGGKSLPPSSENDLAGAIAKVIGNKIESNNKRQKKEYLDGFVNITHNLTCLFGDEVDIESALKDMQEMQDMQQEEEHEASRFSPASSFEEVPRMVECSSGSTSFKIKSTTSSWTVVDVNQSNESPSITSNSSTSGSTTGWSVTNNIHSQDHNSFNGNHNSSNSSGTLKKHFHKQAMSNSWKIITNPSSSSSQSHHNSECESTCKKSKKKRKRKHSMEEGEDEEEDKADNRSEDEEARRKRKKMKKHKKDKEKKKNRHREQSLASGHHRSEKEEDEEDFEWVEKTKETLEQQQQQQQAQIAMERNQDRKADEDAISELRNMNLNKFGKDVCTWDGKGTEVDKQVDDDIKNEKRRNKDDLYNLEYDRGKTKKTKSHRSGCHSNSNTANEFQQIFEQKYMKPGSSKKYHH